MQMKRIVAACAGSLALALSVSTASAGYIQPGETMGVSLTSPLPEGVFFADLEDYGGQGSSPTRVGVNIPVLIWSTPWSFANTRLEMIAAFPFAHVDGGGLNTVGAITQGYGVLLGHDFGNGLTGGIGGLLRTPDVSQNIAAISLRRAVEADFRESLQYKIQSGPFAGITLVQNANVTTGFGQPGRDEGENDMFDGDFAIEKTFDKFTIGFTGFGNIDINRSASTFYKTPVGRNVELGGLIGYDFGRFTLTGIVTHGIIAGGYTPSVTAARGEETRGWLRAIIPLYVAPTAPVIARY